MDIISISKLRILDSVTIEGLKKDMATKGLKPYEAIRNALKEYYSKTPTNGNEEVLKELHTLKVQNRILIKKLFDLSQDEYNELLKKVKQD